MSYCCIYSNDHNYRHINCTQHDFCEPKILYHACLMDSKNHCAKTIICRKKCDQNQSDHYISNKLVSQSKNFLMEFKLVTPSISLAYIANTCPNQFNYKVYRCFKIFLTKSIFLLNYFDFIKKHFSDQPVFRHKPLFVNCTSYDNQH